MRLLLDTHALLWWLLNSPALPETARSAIRAAENEVFVSAASAWEIATKHRLGKLPEAETAATDLPRLLVAARFNDLPMTVSHAMAAGALPGPHRDPFDRMLAAQARLEGLRLVTRDPAFAGFAVETLW